MLQKRFSGSPPPGSSGSNDLLSMNFHQAMAQPLESFDVPDIQTNYPLHNQGVDSERPETPSARPERFTALCFLYCILLGRSCCDSAKAALAQAFETFQTLIVGRIPREVLACLNLVLTCPFRTRPKTISPSCSWTKAEQ
jgi:hypothetical protein